MNKLFSWFKFAKTKSFNEVEQEKLKDLDEQIQKFHTLNNDLMNKIQQVNQLNPNQLKQDYLNAYLNNAKQDFINDFNTRNQEIKLNADKIARNLVLDSLSRIDFDSYKEDLIFKTICKNQETKSRLIGAGGRNKKTFERTTGMELIISQDDDVISISNPNLIKREIAKNLLLRLLDTKNIEPNKIENYYEEEKIKFFESLSELGKDILENVLNIHNLNPGIYPYVGRLKYRNSFGQNVLEHSIEVSLLCEQIARELGLDSNLAKLCGFVHDIGKSVDYESGKSHVDEGVEIASQFNLDPIVIHSIAAHHDGIVSTNEYAAIVKIADKVSASKPGARNNSKDDFFKRVEIYEKICSQFAEVKTCWVLKSGFAIKILVKPGMVKDDELGLLAYRIKKAFEDHSETKTYNITLELIKENVFKIKTDAIN